MNRRKESVHLYGLPSSFHRFRKIAVYGSLALLVVSVGLVVVWRSASAWHYDSVSHMWTDGSAYRLNKPGRLLDAEKFMDGESAARELGISTEAYRLALSNFMRVAGVRDLSAAGSFSMVAQKLSFSDLVLPANAGRFAQILSNDSEGLLRINALIALGSLSATSHLDIILMKWIEAAACAFFGADELLGLEDCRCASITGVEFMHLHPRGDYSAFISFASQEAAKQITGLDLEAVNYIDQTDIPKFLNNLGQVKAWCVQHDVALPELNPAVAEILQIEAWSDHPSKKAR